MMNNQRGIITVDFMFSMVLILGLSGLLFVLTFTLSVASVTQYVTFAAARNYAVGHLNLATQEARAVAKYKELIDDPVLKPLFTNGWYRIDESPTLGDHTRVMPGYADAAAGVNKFWGAGTSFTAAVLEFRIPFFGSTVPDGDGSGGGFQTYLGSYLGREPTVEECRNLIAQRYTTIRTLNAGYGTAPNRAYVPMEDNGC